MEFVEVAGENDLEEGQGKVVKVNGKTIALFRKDGKFYAIDNTCLHAEGPLGEGTLEGETVTCPLHGWQYSIMTGVSPFGVKVDTYKVKVENGRVKIEV